MALDDAGTEVDIPTYIERRLTGQPLPCFKREQRGQGFRAMLLKDHSASMGGEKAKQAERACRIIRRALNYPFVDVDVWGFQSLGVGQVDIIRFDDDVEQFLTSKSGTAGTTPLNVAMRLAVRELQRGQQCLQLFVITDGYPVYQGMDGISHDSQQLMREVRDEVHRARQHGVNVTGVVIGSELATKHIKFMFGPTRYWRRIAVHRKSISDEVALLDTSRLGSELVTLVASSFMEYLKRV